MCNFTIYNFSSYSELINHAKSQNRRKSKETYYESHHIVPRFLGGTNDKGNLVLLTISEHCEAHYLFAMEHQDSQKIYQGNITAALLIAYPRKVSQNKIEHIQKFLSDESFRNMLEEIKIKSRLNRVGNNKGKHFYFQHCWVQFRNQKPESRMVSNLKKFLKRGYKHIDKCPICNQPNSEKNVCCCQEHFELFEEQRLKAIQDDLTEKKKQSWANTDRRERTKESISKAYARRRELREKGELEKKMWVHNPITKDRTQIPISKLEEYKNKGYIEGTFVNCEKRIWVINKQKESCCQIYMEDLDKYKNMGYEKGRIRTWKDKEK